MELPTQELLNEELFRWMGEAELSVLSNCFDMETEWLPAGRTAVICAESDTCSPVLRTCPAVKRQLMLPAALFLGHSGRKPRKTA